MINIATRTFLLLKELRFDLFYARVEEGRIGTKKIRHLHYHMSTDTIMEIEANILGRLFHHGLV